MHVIESAENTVICSHSNPLAVYKHVRNIPDSLIRACTETGGIVGISGIGDCEVPSFIGRMRESFSEENLRQFSNRFAPTETYTGIAAGLLDRGNVAEDAAKIGGGNWLRVAGEVWQ